MSVIHIRDRVVGAGAPAFVIAEVAQNHDGSLGMAHAFIDAVAAVGADAIKFQTHIAEAESTLDEPFRTQFSLQDKDRFSYWKRMEFTFEQWRGLGEHARSRGLAFLSSPFSIAAVEMLQQIDMAAWKVGSGELRSLDLLAAMMKSGGAVICSTGMAEWADIDRAVDWLRSNNAAFAVLQCTSAYPTPFEQVGLQLVDTLRARYDCPTGLSDHSGSIYPSLAAIARSAAIVEVHVTFDRAMFGPDVRVSLTMSELQVVCRMRDAVHAMDSNPVDKNAMSESLAPMRQIFGKSLSLVADLPGGSIIERHMLTCKKPGTGIPPDRVSELVGRRVRHPVQASRLLRWEDIDD